MKKSVIAVLLVIAVLGGCAFGGWKYHEAKIAQMRSDGIAALNATVNLDDYRKKQQKKIKKILTEGEEAINACEKQEEVDKIVEETPEKFKDIKTDAQLTKEEEEEAARKAEEERKAEEARQAELARQQAAAASSSSSNKSSGCVGNDSSNFY